VRTDAAVGFSDPNPYYAGMSTTPSSPFDNIMPWSGMRRVTDASAGELVEIPKFYYKWTRDGVKMKLQISMSQFDGSHVSPAHADRGDGVGERDYVYVGRYHCASDYKSKTGYSPKYNVSRSTARTSIHNLGSLVWQIDFAMWWTINMLYLVEFAHWDSQSKIGYGCGNNSGVQSMGASDSMPYHTGTMKSNRTTYGVGCQYRYIEEWWGNADIWLDGIYFSGNNLSDIYCIKNPADFSDFTGGSKVGERPTTSGFISAWSNPTVSGYEYALYPSAISGSGNTYICDFCSYNSSANAVGSSGFYAHELGFGAFYLFGQYNSTYYDIGTGARLMVLPPNRLSA
jgi:hypothetical protein